MEVIKEYLPYILNCIAIVIYGISAWLFKKSGKNINSIYKEIFDNMNYRKADYLESDQPPKQSFDPLKEQFVLNKHTDELELKPDKLNIQEMINSSVHTELSAVLQRLLPRAVPEYEETKLQLEQSFDDLDTMSAAFDLAEEYRTKYNLPDTMSPIEIYSFIDDMRQKLQTKLDHIKTPLVKEDKEIIENAPPQEDKPQEE